MAGLSIDSRSVGEIGQFVSRCRASLEGLHCCAAKAGCEGSETDFRTRITQVMRMLAVMITAERVPPERCVAGAIDRAARAVYGASQKLDALDAYQDACREAFQLSGIGLFCAGEEMSLDAESLSAMAQALLRPPGDASIDSIFFETVPVNWLGSAYQALLALKPGTLGDGLEASYRKRKEDGIYFTPPYLVQYIVESVVGGQAEDAAYELGSLSLEEKLCGLRILDPSTGGGDFLCATINCLSSGTASTDDALKARIAANCVYGTDIDATAVEVARYCVWAASGYADGISDSINSHIVCADVLGSAVDGSRLCWPELFSEVFDRDRGGFDAVVGNPPYIAAKNNPAVTRSGLSLKGQSDSYLLFLREVVAGGLVRSGGMLAMVLPDPMLVRGNAASVRRTLAEEWSILSLLHLPGAFAEARVANVIPICRNCPPTHTAFAASRIERVADRESFSHRPVQTARELAQSVSLQTVTAQDRAEFLYLLEQGGFAGVIRRIHGEAMALSNFDPPFAPLVKLNVQAIYRGEELGKAAISSEVGDYPMLLGGQSIRPYEILWEGRKISHSSVRKPLGRYLNTKIVIQKSSGRLIAALDRIQGEHGGYVFPQSVYGVELRGSGMEEQYLLCLLNSEVMNEYVRRTVTGYKFLHPQLEIEDIKRLPVRQVQFITPEPERAALLERGLTIFADECSTPGAGVRFAELANFAAECLAAVPEKSDVVHDILVHLGGLVTELTAESRVSPGAGVTARLEMARAAVEAVVWRLYSCEPFQMSLPM